MVKYTVDSVSHQYGGVGTPALLHVRNDKDKLPMNCAEGRKGGREKGKNKLPMNCAERREGKEKGRKEGERKERITKG